MPPRCAEKYIKQLETHLEEIGLGRIGVVSGRYYAMDRDKRWERVEKAYDAMTVGEGIHASSAADAVHAAYERDENDEFSGSLPSLTELCLFLMETRDNVQLQA